MWCLTFLRSSLACFILYFLFNFSSGFVRTLILFAFASFPHFIEFIDETQSETLFKHFPDENQGDFPNYMYDFYVEVLSWKQLTPVWKDAKFHFFSQLVLINPDKSRANPLRAKKGSYPIEKYFWNKNDQFLLERYIFKYVGRTCLNIN